MEPVSEGWSKKQRAFAEPELPPSKKVIPDNEIEGQIIKTSATIADECISVQSHETPAASKYTLKRPSQSVYFSFTSWFIKGDINNEQGICALPNDSFWFYWKLTLNLKSLFLQVCVVTTAEIYNVPKSSNWIDIPQQIV